MTDPKSPFEVRSDYHARAPGAGCRAPASSAARHAVASGAGRLLRVALCGAFALALACGGGGVDSRLEDARALQDAGQFAESIEPLREVIAQEPDLPEANHRLGVALVQTGQASLAVWPLEKAAKSPEYAVPAGLLLASTFLSMNAPDDAARVATQVLETDPERAAALRIRSQAYLGSGRHEEALADAERLVELLPDDYQAAVLKGTTLLTLGRLDQAEQEYMRIKELGLASGDPATAARGCLAVAHFYQMGREDAQRAETEYEACLDAYPTEPLALQLASQFFDASGRPERGTEIWREAVKEAPENLSFRMILAERVAARGNVEEARAILEEAAESFGTPGAWQVLADFHRRHDDDQAAVAAMERAVSLAGGGDDTLRFAQGDLYVETGRLDEAEKVIEALQEPTYKELLRGRVLLERGEPAAALEAFDAGIRRWPNNPGARYLAGLAARDSGDPDRAISELREAVRADSAATDAALVLASLHLQRGDWAEASNFAQTHVAKRDPQSLQAFQLAARAAIGAGEYDSGRATLTEMAKIADSEDEVTLERANLERAATGPAASLEVVQQSGLDLTDPENEPLLRSAVEDLLQLGRSDEALKRVDAALAKSPDETSLRALRGATLARLGRGDQARQAFDQALAGNPDDVAALTGLATLTMNAGDPATALTLLERAIAAAPDDAAPRYLSAQILLAQGRDADAEPVLRKVVREHPGHAEARNDLAWLLAKRGEDLDTALSLAERARKLEPGSADVVDTLGYVQLKRGDAAAAVSLFEEALALRPGDPTIRYHLGLALAQAGNREGAVDALQQAIASGPFPEAEAAQQEIARLQQPQS